MAEERHVVGLTGRQLLGLALGAAVAVGLLQARRRRRADGADRPGRAVTASESVIAPARDPEQVVEELVPPRPARARRPPSSP